LGSGFPQAFLVVTLAALAAALLSLFGLHGLADAEPEGEQEAEAETAVVH